MKKFLSLLLCLILVLSCFSFASAGGIIGLSLNHQKLHEYRSALESEPVRYTSGKYSYILLSDGTAEIVEYIPSVFRINSLKIPAELDGHTVTSIGEGVFRGIQIGTLSLPDTLTFIGNHAFAQTALTEITLPDSLTFLGDGAFAECTFFSVTLPDSLISLGANPFRGCYRLTEMLVSANHPTLEVIDGVLFDKQTDTLICYPLTREGEEISRRQTAYQIPQGTLSIGSHAFADCDLNVITIPDSVTVITANPFVGCSDLEEIRILETHPTLELVDGVLFDKQTDTLICYPLVLEADSYAIPEGTVSVGAYAFDNNDSLKSLSLPDSVLSVEDGAFGGCYYLTEIELSENLAFIGAYAFDCCMDLTCVTLPASAAFIGEGAFRDCVSLKSIHLPSSLTEIGAHTFEGCESLILNALPDSLVAVGNDAFRGCRKLSLSALPSSLISIGNSGFYGCDSLPALTLPDGLISVGDYAFDGCGIDALTLPASLTAIGKSAFFGTKHLTVPAGSYAETYAKENDIPYTTK